MSILNDEEILLNTMGKTIYENYLWDNSEINRHTGRTSRLVNYYAEKFIILNNQESLEIRDHCSAGNMELFNRLSKRLQFLTITRNYYRVYWGELKSTRKAGYIIYKIQKISDIQILLNSNKLIGNIIKDFYTIKKIKLDDYNFSNTIFPKNKVNILLNLRQILLEETRLYHNLIYLDENNFLLIYKQ